MLLFNYTAFKSSKSLEDNLVLQSCAAIRFVEKGAFFEIVGGASDSPWAGVGVSSGRGWRSPPP